MYKYSIADIDSPSQDANIKLEKLALHCSSWWESANRIYWNQDKSKREE